MHADPLEESRFQIQLPEISIFYVKSQKEEHPFEVLPYSFLLQKSVDDMLFGFCLGKPQGHQLDELLACDLADCCFVNERCIDVICLDLRQSDHLRLAHDDGIALGVTGTTVISVDV